MDCIPKKQLFSVNFGLAAQLVNIKGERYRWMTTIFICPELDGIDITDMWCQQDGAACYTALATFTILHYRFESMVVNQLFSCGVFLGHRSMRISYSGLQCPIHGNFNISVARWTFVRCYIPYKISTKEYKMSMITHTHFVLFKF